MTKFYEIDPHNAADARFWAQRIAFGPLAFHGALALRDTGILQALMDGGDRGLTRHEVSGRVGLELYPTTVLLESGLGSRLVLAKGDRFCLTKAGYFVLNDEMTRINFDFVRDICYRGAPHLLDSLKQARPIGLSTLGDWKTLYEGLGELDEPARSSWFDFDHYYSSSAFPDALPHVFAPRPRTLLDVGGNTGKWAMACVRHDPNVVVTILDRAAQLRVALNEAEREGFAVRVRGCEMNLLDHHVPYPEGQDVVWMSQFLSCFSEADVKQLLCRARAALTPRGEVHVLETLWDRQKHDGAAFALQQTSLYFATIANGVSRIYDLGSLEECLNEAGLRVKEIVDGLGTCHTLLRCVRA